MKRTDLFGFVDDDQVLDAEMNYGYTGDSQALQAELTYGTVEDEYASVLEDEESYGEDDGDNFGADDSDDGGDDFGADDSDDDIFGEDEDEIDAMFEDLDKEMGDDLYGAETALTFPPDAQPILAELANAINMPGVMFPQFLQSHGVNPGVVEKIMEWSSFMSGAEDDAEEIGGYLLKAPSFSEWSDLSLEQQALLVRNAVGSATMPGIEFNWDDAMRDAWKKSESSTVRAVMGSAGAALKAFMSKDLAKLWFSLVTEVPGSGPVINALKEWVQSKIDSNISPDEAINGLAIRYWLLGCVYPDIYSWIATKITEQAPTAIVYAVNQSSQAQRTMSWDVPMSVSVQSAVDLLPATPVVMPAPQSMLPSPPTILAFGYVVTITGSVLGFFK